MAKKKFHIFGQVIDQSTNLSIPGRKVEAWDKDVKYSDLLGVDKTDNNGKFEIIFDDSYYADSVKDKLPDLFFKVFDGSELILSTEDKYIKNLEPGETQVILKEGKEMAATPRKDLNGLRVKLWGSPRIYIIDQGLKRHIPNPDVYHMLFSTSGNIVEDLNIDSIPSGPPIPLFSKLIRFGENHTTYFLDGDDTNKIKRIIPGEAIERYKFNIPKLHKFPVDTSFPDGPPIEMPDWWYDVYPG